jgi:hypothetical protein
MTRKIETDRTVCRMSLSARLAWVMDLLSEATSFVFLPILSARNYGVRTMLTQDEPRSSDNSSVHPVIRRILIKLKGSRTTARVSQYAGSLGQSWILVG